MTKEEPKHPKSKTRKAPKKVFDVVPPGKSPAPPNSRSVIAGHKKHVQDDQFVPEHPLRLTGDPSEKRPLMDSRKKVALSPGRPAVSEEVTEEAPAGKEPAAEVESTKSSASSAIAKDDGAVERAIVTPGETTAPLISAKEMDKANEAPWPTTPASPQPTAADNASARSYNEAATSEHLADLAIEQVVETTGFDESTTTAPGETVTTTPDNRSLHDQSLAGQPIKTTDDLLAESSAPNLEPQKAIVSTHRRHAGAGEMILIFLLIIVVAALVLNFLLDAGVVKTGMDVPYTDLIN